METNNLKTFLNIENIVLRSDAFKVKDFYYSTHNKYIPLYSIFHNNIFEVENKKGILLEYNSLDKNSYGGVPLKTYNELYNKFKSRFTGRYALIRKNKDTIFIRTYYNNMFFVENDKIVPLLQVGVDSNYIINNNYKTVVENPESKYFKLFVNSILLTDENFYSFWRKVSKEFIPNFYTHGIDVIITNNTGQMYNKNFNPNFKNKKEMIKVLKDEVQLIMLDNEF